MVASHPPAAPSSSPRSRPRARTAMLRGRCRRRGFDHLACCCDSSRLAQSGRTSWARIELGKCLGHEACLPKAEQQQAQQGAAGGGSSKDAKQCTAHMQHPIFSKIYLQGELACPYNSGGSSSVEPEVPLFHWATAHL